MSGKKEDSILKSRDVAVKVAQAALAKKALDVTVLDVGELTVIAEYFVLCSGDNITQVRAISNSVDEELSRTGIHPRGREGLEANQWILLDYGDIIVHIFEKETREFYALEKLWLDAKIIPFDEDKTHMGRKNKGKVH